MSYQAGVKDANGAGGDRDDVQVDARHCKSDKFRSKREWKNRWLRTLAEGERRNVDDQRRVEDLQGGVCF
jgi:hypothetical protein